MRTRGFNVPLASFTEANWNFTSFVRQTIDEANVAINLPNGALSIQEEATVVGAMTPGNVRQVNADSRTGIGIAVKGDLSDLPADSVVPLEFHIDFNCRAKQTNSSLHDEIWAFRPVIARGTLGTTGGIYMESSTWCLAPGGHVSSNPPGIVSVTTAESRINVVAHGVIGIPNFGVGDYDATNDGIVIGVDIQNLSTGTVLDLQEVCGTFSGTLNTGATYPMLKDVQG